MFLDRGADAPRCTPGLTWAMPTHMHSWVMATSRRARMDVSPTQNMRLVSPCQPSLMVVMSRLTMSPFFSARSFGTPWQT
jgi:hypothetical protein